MVLSLRIKSMAQDILISMDQRERVKARREIHRHIKMIEDNLNDGTPKSETVKVDAKKRITELRQELRNISKEVTK